jgi:hypothetical protein
MRNVIGWFALTMWWAVFCLGGGVGGALLALIMWPYL